MYCEGVDVKHYLTPEMQYINSQNAGVHLCVTQIMLYVDSSWSACKIMYNIRGLQKITYNILLKMKHCARLHPFKFVWKPLGYISKERRQKIQTCQSAVLVPIGGMFNPSPIEACKHSSEFIVLVQIQVRTCKAFLKKPLLDISGWIVSKHSVSIKITNAINKPMRQHTTGAPRDTQQEMEDYTKGSLYRYSSYECVQWCKRHEHLIGKRGIYLSLVLQNSFLQKQSILSQGIRSTLSKGTQSWFLNLKTYHLHSITVVGNVFVLLQ